MGFTCGIIGLPNVGKSTIFNALTSAKAASANFPFCTIEPNTGAVPVPDDRLAVLSDLNDSEKIIPTQITFVDIAGLIKGASKGEGLGNQFLGHIRSVDALAQVVRAFDDPGVIHVEGSVGPRRDIETIDTELLLADLEAVQKQISRVEKLLKSGDKDAKLQFEALNKLEAHMSSGKPARFFELPDHEEIAIEIKSNLLTAKPMLFVANVEERDLNPGAVTPPLKELREYCQEHSYGLVEICGKLESEIAELSANERKSFLDEVGLESSGLDRLALAGHKILDLITFFTTGPKETHAWTAQRGLKAPACAGKIHTDFEKGFIRAEVISYTDYVEAGGEVRAREKGKLRVEGKDYVMQDGDIVHFRFNV